MARTRVTLRGGHRHRGQSPSPVERCEQWLCDGPSQSSESSESGLTAVRVALCLPIVVAESQGSLPARQNLSGHIQSYQCYPARATASSPASNSDMEGSTDSARAIVKREPCQPALALQECEEVTVHLAPCPDDTRMPAPAAFISLFCFGIPDYCGLSFDVLISSPNEQHDARL